MVYYRRCNRSPRVQTSCRLFTRVPGSKVRRSTNKPDDVEEVLVSVADSKTAVDGRSSEILGF